ncbi:TetR/AcrR family transcriptional regulator [bacterium]|nr:TetR/AcrR family transcriptional regulator [bacterium]
MNPKVDKKTKIIKSARDLFHSKGYNATTVDDIVKNAGVGKGTFYRYFKNKTELLIIKMDKIHEDFKDILSDCIRHEGTLKENLETALNAFLDYYRKHIFFFRILDEQSIIYPDIIGKAIKERICENLKHFRGFVVKNIENNNLIDCDPDLILKTLFIFFHGAKEVESKTGIIMDKTTQKNLVNLILNGIKK